MNDLVKHESRPVIAADDVNPISMMFDPVIAERVKVIAQTMSQGKVSVPEHLRNNIGDCLAIVMQAASWRLNPFAVAQKTHIIQGRLGYEAQLVSAVTSSLGILEGRFRYEYEGDWSKTERRPKILNNRPTAAWAESDEQGLAVIVYGKLRGEPDIREHRLAMATVWPRNSPLWVTAPQQQIAYLAVKQWVRKYAPDAILGVYTTDEIQQQPIEVVGSSDASSEVMARARAIEKTETVVVSETPVDETQEALPPADDTQTHWPSWDADGVLVDARSVPYSEHVYSKGKNCNDDGSWRRRRGVSQAAIDAYEARYLVKIETGGQDEEQAQDENREVGRDLNVTGMTEDEMIERIKGAKSVAELDHSIAAVESHPAWDDSVKADLLKLARDYRAEWAQVEAAQG